MDAVPLSSPEVQRTAEPIAGPWTSFLVAVQFLLLFPLLPLGAELLFTGKITIASLTLVTATYAISLSMSSRNLLSWAFGFMLGFIFSTLFGWASAPGNHFARRTGWMRGRRRRAWRSGSRSWSSWGFSRCTWESDSSVTCRNENRFPSFSTGGDRCFHPCFSG